MIFGQAELLDGIDNIPVMIGVYGLAEMFKIIRNNHEKVVSQKLNKVVPSFKDVKRLIPNILRSSIIGTVIGSIPAAGGALIPMMTLGIPGDPMTAVLMGGLIIQGLRPGPILFQQQMPFVSSIFISLLLSVVFMLIIGLLGARVFSKLITVRKNYLIPAVLVFCLVGSYAINNSMFDIGDLSEGDWTTFFTRPFSLFFIIIVFLVLAGPSMMTLAKKGLKKQ